MVTPCTDQFSSNSFKLFILWWSWQIVALLFFQKLHLTPLFFIRCVRNETAIVFHCALTAVQI